MDEQTYANAVEDLLVKARPQRTTLQRLAGRVAGLEESLVLEDGLIADSVHRLVHAAAADDQTFEKFLEQAQLVFPKFAPPPRPLALEDSSTDLESAWTTVESGRMSIVETFRSHAHFASFEIDDLYAQAAKAQLVVDHLISAARISKSNPTIVSAASRVGEVLDRLVEQLHYLRLITDLVEAETSSIALSGATEADQTAAQLMRRRELTNARTQAAASLSRLGDLVARARKID